MSFLIKPGQTTNDAQPAGSRQGLVLIFLISILLIASYVAALAVFEPDSFADTGLGRSFGAAGQSLNLYAEPVSESDWLNFGSNILKVRESHGLDRNAAAPISVGEKGRENPFEPIQ